MHNPLQAIEAIIEEGRKASTYKLALLRSINDWIIENPVRHGPQRIPVSWLAVRFIDHYWPLLMDERPVRQTVGGRGDSQLHRCFEAFAASDGPRRLTRLSPRTPQYWAAVRSELLARAEGLPSVHRLVADVRRVVLDQPMQYLHNVSGARVELFGLRSGGKDDYEEVRRLAMDASQGRWVRGAGTLEELLADDPTVLWVPESLYSGMIPLRYCIRAALIGRWAQLCESMPENEDVGPILPRLEAPVLERDAAAMRQYRGLYGQAGLGTCWISGEPLSTRWDLDHVVPWSRLPVQSFWNLAPANPGPNSRKSNHLVRLEGDVGERYAEHVEVCLGMEGPLIRRDVRRLFGPEAEPGLLQPRQVVEHSRRIVEDMLENTGLPEWNPGRAAHGVVG